MAASHFFKELFRSPEPEYVRPAGGCARPTAAGAGAADVPAVSVIVPAYNAGKWLDRCLTSVLAQDFRSFELIVVNDGSTDSTGSVIDAFAARDSRVRAIHQPNRGVSLARQAGMDAARGVWLQFLDADDELLPGALGALAAKGEATGADIVAAPFVWCREGGVRERSAGPEFDRLSGTEYFGEMLRGRAYWALWSNFQRKSLHTADIRMFPRIAIGEDQLMMLQILLRNPTVVALDRPVLNYYVHSMSATQGGVGDRKKYRDLQFVHDFMHDLLARYGVERYFEKDLLEHDARILQYGICWGGLRDQVACGRRAGGFLRAHPQVERIFFPRQLRFVRLCRRSMAAGWLKALYYRMKGKSF